ncbi:MAG: hypothetical protein KF902_00155 [Phycisphaeraceae bacterium]|nr:hypothetical protein [Phycisphaeraceae bacterium]
MLAIGFGTPSVACAEDPLVRVTFAADNGWAFHPAVEGGSVVGYLAQSMNPQSVPNGLEVVWYARTTEGYILDRGWIGTDIDMIAASLALDMESPDLFAHSALADATAVLIGECGVEVIATLEIENGLEVGDPIGAVAHLLEPGEIQAYVESGAVGADILSALEIDTLVVNGVVTSQASIGLTSLTEAIEIDIAGGEPDNSILGSLCIPGTRCRSTTVVGPCTLVGGFGNGSCSGCKYTCATTTLQVCAYFDALCNVGPATTTTTTGTSSKSCAGNATNCPASPPPGC